MTGSALIGQLLAGDGERIGAELDDGVLTLEIRRPEVRNAVDRKTAQEIAAAIDYLDAAEEVKVAVICGAGNTFCSGMDLRAFAATGELPSSDRRGFAGLAQRPPDKPVIAAVEGYAVAGGMEIVLACDLVVAAEDAQFGLPEVRRGLVAAAGGLLRLPFRVPRNVAMELALTGEFLPARRAFELGLVNQMVPPGTARQVAQGMAHSIGENAPLAVRMSKKIIKSAMTMEGDAAYRQQSAAAAEVLRSEDAVEGARAFAEKRVPRWRGR
jgi:enoyl-CoA hydratase